ncbi:MAG: hypothetical protein QXJ14_03295 [Candidatus Aenigmatarchaeota archaeon]
METIKLGYEAKGVNIINAPQYIQGVEGATTSFIQSIVNEYNKQTNKKIINYEVIAINEVKGNYINFAKVNLYSNQTVQSFGVIVNALFSYLIANWQALVMAGLVALALFGLLQVDRIKITAEGIGSIELDKNGNVIGDLPPDSGGSGGGNDGGSNGGDGGGSDDSKSKGQSSFPIWLLGILALGYLAFKKK